MFLPLREAAKASILSSKWRNLWTNLPTLVIDESFGDEIAARRSNANEEEVVGKLDEVVGKLILLDVCRVLMLHRGPLINFSLSLHKCRKWVKQVDQILQFLPYNTLQSLTIVNGGYCILSNPLLSSFSQLKVLCLSSCTFTFSPVSFEGFDSLTFLELRKVLFEDTKSEIIFICPLLTTLIFDSCEGNFENILVEEAPKLGRFYVVGSFASLDWSNDAPLKNVTIRQTRAELITIHRVNFITVESLSIGNIWKVMQDIFNVNLAS
ncbi:F-box/FBD/LRR-repeat protein At1g13570 [Linum perenne]